MWFVSKIWFASKARCVQSLKEDFAVFAAVFAPAFPAVLVSADVSAAAAFSAVSASAFAFTEWDLDFYLSFWQVDLGRLLELIEISKIL
jgi:hypothetical protein